MTSLHLRLYAFALGVTFVSTAIIGTPPEPRTGGVGWDGGGYAADVLIVNIEDVNGVQLLTISGEMKKGPSCAKSKSILVIAKAEDAVAAKRAIKYGHLVKVFGRGECNKVGTYETLYGIEPKGGWSKQEEDPDWSTNNPLAPKGVCRSVSCQTGN